MTGWSEGRERAAGELSKGTDGTLLQARAAPRPPGGVGRDDRDGAGFHVSPVGPTPASLGTADLHAAYAVGRDARAAPRDPSRPGPPTRRSGAGGCRGEGRGGALATVLVIGPALAAPVRGAPACDCRGHDDV